MPVNYRCSAHQTTFNMLQPLHTPPTDTHLCSVHSTSSPLLFLLVQSQLLAHLNNSFQVRSSISYSILNMPKRATDRRQEARLQLGLLLQTMGDKFISLRCPPVLWAINFVPGSFLRPFSPPLVFFFFLSSLMLLTSRPAPFPCLVSSLHLQVSDVCVRVCVCVHRPWHSVTWDQMTVESEKRRLFFRVAEMLLTNWMRCKSSQQASDFNVTHEREREREKLHTRHCSNTNPPYTPPPVHRHVRHANGLWSTSFVVVH